MTQENTNKQVQDKNYRWNFTVNLLDGASFWFGSSFISSSTIIPLFISKLTPSLIPIGLLSVIASAGWFLPQLFSARITERSSKMKKFCVGWSVILERLPIWVLIIRFSRQTASGIGSDPAFLEFYLAYNGLWTHRTILDGSDCKNFSSGKTWVFYRTHNVHWRRSGSSWLFFKCLAAGDI